MDGSADGDEFLKAIYHLNELKTFQNAGIFIGDGDVAEVNSKKHLPLQVMDVVLGAMCFRLNDKHKERGIVAIIPGTCFNTSPAVPNWLNSVFSTLVINPSLPI